MRRFLPAFIAMLFLLSWPVLCPLAHAREKGNLTGVLLPYVPHEAEPSATGGGEKPQKAVSSKSTAVKTAVTKKKAPQKEPVSAAAARKSPGKEEDGKTAPISITALRMEADNKAGWVLFVGKVKAVQKDMVLTSDRLRVYLDAKGKVKNVLAKGHVRVEQAGRVITSSQAEYSPSKETVIFTGSPKAWQGKNVVMGKRIIYFVKEKRSTVEGGNGKVSAVLFPKEKKGGK